MSLPLTDAYPRFRGLLFGALKGLAKQGLPVPPQDALDHVHDFFAWEWENVARTFDPGKGPPEPYVRQAFLRYVRPRIVRSLVLSRSLRPSPEGLDVVGTKAEAPESRIEDNEQRRTLAAVDGVLQGLPSVDRDLLRAYFVESRPSIRSLVPGHAKTRYVAKQKLVAALGRVAIEMRSHGTGPKLDWDVAVAVWKEQRTLANAAMSLGWTRAEVAAAHRRNFAALARVLSPVRRTENQGVPAMNIDLLLRRVLHEKVEASELGDLLAEVQGRAPEIADYLDRAELTDDEDRALDASRLERFYEALEKGLGAPTAGAAEDIADAYADERKVIADAVIFLVESIGGEQTLIERLPPVGTHDKELLKEFLREPDVRPFVDVDLVKGLLPWGLTPGRIASCIKGLGLLLERVHRGKEPILLDAQRGVRNEGGSEIVPAKRLWKEIRAVSHVADPTAQALLDWCCFAAGKQPFLFAGYRSSAAEKGVVRLVAREDDYTRLGERWLAGLAQSLAEPIPLAAAMKPDLRRIQIKEQAPREMA